MSIVKVFIQNEKGSSTRNRYNEETLEFLESMELCCILPYHYGFIPGTVVDDGDCIDFWIVTETSFPAGTIVDCEVLGLMEMFEGEEKDFKVIGRPVGDCTELTRKVFNIIRDYTYEVFTQFPDVTIRVGELLSAGKAKDFIAGGGES